MLCVFLLEPGADSPDLHAAFRAFLQKNVCSITGKAARSAGAAAVKVTWEVPSSGPPAHPALLVQLHVCLSLTQKPFLVSSCAGCPLGDSIEGGYRIWWSKFLLGQLEEDSPLQNPCHRQEWSGGISLQSWEGPKREPSWKLQLISAGLGKQRVTTL